MTKQYLDEVDERSIKLTQRGEENRRMILGHSWPWAAHSSPSARASRQPKPPRNMESLKRSRQLGSIFVHTVEAWPDTELEKSKSPKLAELIAKWRDEFTANVAWPARVEDAT